MIGHVSSSQLLGHGERQHPLPLLQRIREREASPTRIPQ
jgi:hypothetical protein